jgi:pimeloyl-ACP methyl ester carboxylesterase
METPTRCTVTIHGHELSYLDSGTGSVVLIIHGILGSQRQWTHLGLDSDPVALTRRLGRRPDRRGA